MKTNEERNALKEEVETLSRKLHALSEEDLSQVAGGNSNKQFVTELTDELIKSGNFLVPINGFTYKGEYYTTPGAIGLMAHFISPTGKNLFIPQDNIL